MPRFWDSRKEQRAVLKIYCKGFGLEVGCGYKKIIPDSIGMDILKDDPKCVADIFGDATDLTIFKDSLFDYIISCHVLEHLAYTKKALSEWYRVLTPNGVLALSVPNGKCEFERTVGWPCHESVFTIETLGAFLENAGFKITRIEEILEGEDKRSDLLAIAKKDIKEAG